MSAGLSAYKEDGSLLFDTEKITYGLLKSGYLALLTTWPRLNYRSANLDPNDGSSWSESSYRDNIFGFSVTGAVAPIVFISGLGVSVGSSRAGDTTTFYYTGATISTKYYYFDSMRDTLTGAGLKCYSSGGTLTFNSLQCPLNIFETITAPPPPPSVIIAGRTAWLLPYVGATITNTSISPGGPPNVLSSVILPLPPGEYAASLPFSRSITMGGRDGYYPDMVAAAEGAAGVSNGVRFMFTVAARTTQLLSTTYSEAFYNIPTDRYPTAMIIRVENLPFPFN
jgi:hypothetical protein